jgi:hypothetical protein
MVAFVWTPFDGGLRIVKGTRKAGMKRSCPMEPWGVNGEQPRSGAMGGGGREEEARSEGESGEAEEEQEILAERLID